MVGVGDVQAVGKVSPPPRCWGGWSGLGCDGWVDGWLLRIEGRLGTHVTAGGVIQVWAGKSGVFSQPSPWPVLCSASASSREGVPSGTCSHECFPLFGWDDLAPIWADFISSSPEPSSLFYTHCSQPQMLSVQLLPAYEGGV